MPFSKDNPEAARAAAKKRWEKARQNPTELSLTLPDYGTSGPLPEQGVAGEVELAPQLPVTRDLLAGGIAEWDDDVYNVDPEAYQLMRTCPCVVSPVNKLAFRTASLDLVVVGEGERAKAIQDIIDQSVGMPELIEWLTWARIEGVRFCQIKRAATREGGNIWIVPCFLGGGRKKQKAGGTIQWDGRRLVEVQQTTGVTHHSPKSLPTESFITFRPGAGSNPEGDLELGMACYRIAYNWNEALKNMDAYMELYGVPARIIKRKLDKAKPTQVNTLLTDAAQRLALMRNDKQMALSDEDVIELLEPKGKGFEDLTKYAQYLEGVVQMMILLNTLTSDTKQAGPAGSSTVHLTEEDRAVWYNAHLIAEVLNTQLLPWIKAKNPDLPPLGEGESEPHLMFQQHGNREGEEDVVLSEGDIDPDLSADGQVPPQPSADKRVADEPEVIVSGNPWRVEKQGDKYVVIEVATGEIAGSHDTAAEAEAQRAALEAAENE